MSSPLQFSPTPPRVRGRRLTALLLAAAPALSALAACGHPAPSVPAGPAPVVVHAIPGALGGSSGCLPRDDTSQFPPISTTNTFEAAHALPFAATPAPVGDGGYSSDGADLRLQQVITDFPVPPGAGPGPDLAVTLVQLGGHVGPASGWNPDQQLALQATRLLGPGQVMTWQTCMLTSPGIEAAMRAAGRTPQPATAVPSNGAVSGWVAFAAPRQADSLAVAISVNGTDGGGGSTAVPLTKPTLPGLVTSAGTGPAKPTPAPPAH